MGSNLSKYTKERLAYEAERLRRIERDYPYSKDEAISKLKQELEDFKEGELDDWEKKGIVETRFINGERRFFAGFLDNLLFKEELGLRRKNKSESAEKSRRLVNERATQILKGEKKRFRVTAGIRLKMKKEDFYRVWLPFPVENGQISNVRILNSDPEGGVASSSPQRTLYLEGRRDDFRVEFQYDISEWAPGDKYDKPDPGSYLAEKLPHVAFTPLLKKLTADVVAGASDQRDKAFRIYRWITKNVRYSYVPEYCLFDNISEFAATNLRGDCGVQALLFITMCRIAGIPAKWQSGWFISPLRTSPHDWAQVYLDGGWIPVDPSFGGSRRSDEALTNFYFGGLDAFRMIANEDFQSELVPEKVYPRSDPVDNQRGEVETRDGNVYYDQFDWSVYVRESHVIQL